MTAVTQRVDSYLGGVSRQSDDKKLPGQVIECLNGYPDPTFGLTQRPGFKWITNLTDSSAGQKDLYNNCKWFYIHRDDDEKYVGCIKPKSGSVPGNIEIWNTDDGTKCTVNDDSFTVTVANNGTNNVQTVKDVATTGGTGSGMTVNITASGGVATAIDVCKPGSGYAANDVITITAALAGGTGTAGANVTGTITVVPASHYLSGARTNYDILTVQDTSVITNNLITVTKQADPSFTSRKRATLVITGNVTATTDKYDVTINIGSGDKTMTQVVAASGDTYDDVLGDIKTNLDSLSSTHSLGLTVTKYATSIEISRSTTFTITAKGGIQTDKLSVFQDQVDNVSQLPSQSFNNHVVKIINTTSDKDTYFSKFVADDGTSGVGYWEETLDPSKSPGLTASTMPHELINSEKNVFTFKPITWTARLVGDDVTNSHPSFVDAKIQQAFFHNNRLGFLSKDNISLSQSGDFYNFYFTSAQTVVDSDPVDISCSSIRPAALHAVIPMSQGLVLFSQNQQFILQGSDGILTPGSSNIKAISNYEMDKVVDPVDMGTNINFISKTPGYTRIFSMITRGMDENPVVSDVGRIVNEWVPSNIDTLIASPQNQFIALSSQNSDKIYFYRTYAEGDQLLIKSWFNWQLPGTVQSIAVDSDDMYVVTKQANDFTLLTANLSQSPEDAIIVNNDGQRVNPCIDLYCNPTSVTHVAGGVGTSEYSKCVIPWNNITGLKPIVVIAGSTAAGTFVQSGFTIKPEYVAAAGGNPAYFKVVGEDLSSGTGGVTLTDVIIGFVYNFDITLPKTYFRIDPQTADYTAALTIARMKFSVGLSGVMGFKLKSLGVLTGEKKVTGDGTTTNFKWIKEDLDYIDRDQIKVKKNNVVVSTDDYSFVNDTEIQFDTAPAKDDSISIYMEDWYLLDPVQKANTYLADDVALDDSSVFTIPIHQKSDNFTLRVFNDSPFPTSLNSMSWEGNYTPRYYRRA